MNKYLKKQTQFPISFLQSKTTFWARSQVYVEMYSPWGKGRGLSSCQRTSKRIGQEPGPINYDNDDDNDDDDDDNNNDDDDDDDDVFSKNVFFVGFL